MHVLAAFHILGFRHPITSFLKHMSYCSCVIICLVVQMSIGFAKIFLLPTR
ncbi:hypothetical protein HMPREF0239_00818 [Clostridium sp. ATCC BAA-442]|nr:hypothetical protein HMPREF0239_00818 [Clostridium sp. ATCC BAA-442]